MMALVAVILIALSVWTIWKIRKNDPAVDIVLFTWSRPEAGEHVRPTHPGTGGGFFSGHIVDLIAVERFAIFDVGDVLAVGGMTAFCIGTLVLRADLRNSNPG